MAENEEEHRVPEPEMTVQIDGKDVKLFMSYPLLNRLVMIMGPTKDAMSSVFEARTSEAVMSELFVKRGEYGVLANREDYITMKLTPPDANKIWEWVVEHYLDFFIGAAKTALKVSGQTKELMASLTPSPNGSGSLAQPSVSAGPSENDQAS